jgi:hypothetical protein
VHVAAAANHACVCRRAVRPVCVSLMCLCAENNLNDLHVYDPAVGAWTDLSAARPPSPRYHHGFTSAGGKLYVHGGNGIIGEGGAGRGWAPRGRLGVGASYHETGGAAGRRA